MLLYGVTVALGAFLLFEAQPIVAKMILPWFGGSAAVWTTALMFFQIALLAGYVYSYCSIRYFRPKTQALLHAALLGGSLLALPIIPSVGWKSAGGDPALRIVLLLAASLGLPYFMLSATGPLLQAWYAASHPGKVPYRLFAVSNAGSMLALISFPVAIEPWLTGRVQALAWSAAYAAFAVLCAGVALRPAVRCRVEPVVAADERGGLESPPRWSAQALWVALPACASALLLAITNHITQNVAPIPLLWVLTLALYLLSFILCFESERTYRRAVFLPLLAITLAAMGFGIYFNSGNLRIDWAVPLFAGGLFVCSMACHGELARLKPAARHLTKFYLSLALGGALGGLFVAVAAPRLFNSYLELPLSLVACAASIAIVLWPRIPRLRLRAAAALFVAALTGYLAFSEISDRARFLVSERNFYGVLRVTEEKENNEWTPMRKLVNGTIVHGQQLSDPARRREATSYYGEKSGIGRAIRLKQEQRGSLRVGVIGLGAGVIAAYCRPGDAFRFYEINALDIAVARRYFTFLGDCPGDCKALLGDARLVLERQPAQNYDVLAVDAFSSDAIPIHLLTREAFALYFRHLKPDGILAVHISNRYLDLAPVVARGSEDCGRMAFEISDEAAKDYLSGSDWVLVGPDSHLFTLMGFRGAPVWRRGAPANFRTWTDDYSNLFQILR